MAYWKQHPDLWFDDGNLVIQAEQTLFKVFKSVLSKESRVFADMTSLPWTPSKSDTYDGCPMVRMPDSAEEMEVFLSVIYDHSALDKIHGNPKLATLLLVATKYQASTLRQRAVAALQLEFPDTLERFDFVRSQEPEGKAENPHFWELCIATLKAARRTGASILLPAALTRATQRPIEDIVVQDTLDAVDRIAIVVGRELLSKQARVQVYGQLSDSIHNRDCELKRTSTPCMDYRRYLLETLEKQPNYYDPFLLISVNSVTANEINSHLCPSCHYNFYRSNLSGRQSVWKSLPSVFGLPPWEEL